MSVGANVRVGTLLGSLPLANSAVGAERARLPMIDAMRALAALVILGHHFSSYPPFAVAAAPIAGPLIDLLHANGRIAQVFIVLSGFILAGSLSQRVWDRQRVRRFIIQRYCRLALPYLAAAGLAALACAYGRNWVDDEVVGAIPTIDQLLAHVVFLQDILGYESLSTGLWFVCISFQLSLIYVVGLYIRDIVAGRTPPHIRERLKGLPLALGWLLAGASLFYFNRDRSWENWAVYFFGQFFLGVLVHHALQNARGQKYFTIYVMIVAVALALQWRTRLAGALATGLVLFISGKVGALTRWPSSNVVAFMGRISYSLFLIHFPVLVVVATLWVKCDWTSPPAAIAGLFVAFLLSIAAATLFYRFVEAPAMRMSRRLA